MLAKVKPLAITALVVVGVLALIHALAPASVKSNLGVA